MWLEILICQSTGMRPSGNHYRHAVFLIWFWTFSGSTGAAEEPGTAPTTVVGSTTATTKTARCSWQTTTIQVRVQRVKILWSHLLTMIMGIWKYIKSINKDKFPENVFEIFLFQGLQQFSIQTGEFQISLTSSSSTIQWSEWSVYQWVWSEQWILLLLLLSF